MTMGNGNKFYMGTKLSAPPDFAGPTLSSKQRLTDVICMLLLWTMWISLTALGIYAMQNGDYRLMVHPLDYAGNRECENVFGLVSKILCVVLSDHITPHHAASPHSPHNHNG